MRLLVTGGAGFIGSNLVHHAIHRASGADDPPCCPEHQRYGDGMELDAVLNVDALTYAADPAHLDGVDGSDRYRFAETDIRDAEAVDGLFEEFEPDGVIHLAAESHVDRSIEGPSVFVETNVLGTQVLLEAARDHGVDRFVHVSTDEVYGSIQEGSFTEKDPLDPSSPYSATKAGSDLLALAYHRTYDLPVAVTRCTNNYGPRQHPEKLIPKMITRARKGETLPIYGDGSNVRDWLYVKDHCEALLRVLAEGVDGGIYNIAGRDERTNLEVVHLLLDLLDRPESLIEFVEDRPGHDFRYSVDDDRIRALGWAPRVGFEEGLERTIDWYVD